MTIVTIVGTSGAGKSTVVRQLIEAMPPGQLVRREQNQEIGRILNGTIFIAGRYDEWDTAGCDTIKDVGFWYGLFAQKAREGYHVVFEGLFMMNHTRGLDLVKTRIAPVHILHLQTTLDECKIAINARRLRRGQTEFKRSWDNTKGHIKRAANYAGKLKDIGATVHKVTREDALAKLMDLLRG